MGKRTKFKCIYVLTGPDKVAYVGQTTDPVNRKSRYKTLTCKNQTDVYASLIKHGYENHEFKILLRLSDDSSRRDLDIYEQIFYEWYQASGYTLLNLKSPGWHGRPNAIALQRASAAHKGARAWNKGLKGAQVAWNKGLKKADYAKR